MKNRKGICVCILAGMLSCSYCMTAGADSYVNGGILKNGLLADKSVNLSEYNTNDDNQVNVIDLVRVKNRILKSNQTETQYVSLSCEGPWVSDDKSKITVPVSIKGNTAGVSAVSFKVEYNNWYFQMSDVYPSSDGKASFSLNNDVVQFTTPDGENMRREGYLLYIEFTVSPDVPEDLYEIELSGIQCAMKKSDGTARELTNEECKRGTVLSFDFFRETIVQQPVTTVPDITTAAATTTSATVTTAAKTTTAVTTTVTSPEQPKADKLTFSLDNAELSQDGSKLKIPVYMDVNEKGLNSLNMNIKYDQNKFRLSGVDIAGFDGYAYVAGNQDNVVISMNNGQNITQKNCIVGYLNFDVNGGADSKTYDFELRDIKAYYSENWNQKQIDKLENKSKIYKYTLGGGAVVTEPPKETTVSITSPVTTTTVTTEALPVITTTVSTVTDPPPVTTTAAVSDENVELSSEERKLVDLINNYRETVSMRRYSVSDSLCKVARVRAEELSVSFSGNRPGGGSVSDLLDEYNVGAGKYSATFTATQTSAADVIDVVERKLKGLTDSSMTRIGVANVYVPGSQYQNYWYIIVV